MLAGHKVCASLDTDFETLFPNQYCLARSHQAPDIPEWSKPEPLLGWTLLHCHRINCQTIEDNDGKRLGWLLGVAVDQDGTVVSKMGLQISAALTDPKFWSQVETQITDLAGKYIAFVITPMGKRIYFDPVMDLPAVYNVDEQIIASSPLLALRRQVEINPCIDYRIILKEGGNFGMQQTCDPDVMRGMSNHYLDLDNFTLHRHWPNENDTFDNPDEPLSTIAETIVERLGQIVGAIAENYDCALPVTGGNDSRTLIYSIRNRLKHVKKIYVHKINWITSYDCVVTAMIADDLGIGLQLIDAQKELNENTIPSSVLHRLKWSFQHRTGYDRAPGNPILMATHLVPSAELALRGNVMDMTRANQWRSNTLKISVDHGLTRLAIGGRPRKESIKFWRDAYITWMETLPEKAQLRTYDFAFVEHLLPNTLGARLLGYGTPSYVNPFNDRRLIAMSMRINPHVRKAGKFNEALHIAAGAHLIPFASDLRQDEATKLMVEKILKNLSSGKPTHGATKGVKIPKYISNRLSLWE